MMSRDPFRLVKECLEGHAYHTARADAHYQRGEQAKEQMHAEIAGAYLRRSEMLTEREG
jgi:hypothetical protein